MYESGYYPMGAENDPNAPWNRKEEDDVEPIDVDVEYYVVLRKRTTLETTDYHTEVDCIEEQGIDGDIYRCADKRTVIDQKDFLDDFEKQHYTPMYLIKILKAEMLYKIEHFPKIKGVVDGYYQKIVEECDNWIDEEEDCYEVDD